MIVADASVLANALGDDGRDGAVARQLLRDAADLALPDLAEVEAAAVLRKRWIAHTLDDQRFHEAIGDLLDLPGDRYAARHLLPRAVELRATVTVYDAMYVALAELLGCPLVTADARLARAPGPRCEIRVL